VTFSTIARNQMQAMQMAQFTLLAVFPAVRLHVPVQGHAGLGAMGRRAVSHHPCAAIVRGVLLKGNGLCRDRSGAVADRAFTLVVAVIATWCYRVTLDYNVSIM
jgi:ABC-2 type transport system permease protein